MVVTPIKTEVVEAGKQPVSDLLDNSLEALNESSIVAISAKVIALCENRVVPIEGIDKQDLVSREADYYLPASTSKFGYQFTIINNTLVASAGIDESNGNGLYVFWPANPQKSANSIRKYLKERFGLKKVGVIITDSTCLPLRWGTIGIAVPHGGFRPLNNYMGSPICLAGHSKSAGLVWPVV